MTQSEFKEYISRKGHELYRDMPWRHTTTPYYVLVSELMLQQTQVDRVRPKFDAFVERFPNVAALADASLADVLTLWSGLGYNRRAKYLHDAARYIQNEQSGAFPTDHAGLRQLPGVGPGTAGAIMAYAYNQPVVFIETNVRTVYFHHFFEGRDQVTDKEIMAIVAQTIDTEHPREFYWALMDYGTWLKRQRAGSIRASRHYKKQSALEGSVRQVRGQIVKCLATGDKTYQQLSETVGADDRFAPAIDGLLRDGLIQQSKEYFHLTK